MVATVTPSKPAAPAAPPVNVVAEANKSLAAAKTGPEPLRPIRHAITFIKGTVSHGLDGLATWGRRGFFAGVALGALVGIASPLGIAAVFMGAGWGLAGAGGFGALVGLVTGGRKEVARELRGEKYAEDLIVRGKMQNNAGPSKADYRAYHRENQMHRSYALEQILQREKEIRHDSWVEREGQRGNHGHGGGVGF